MGRVYTNPDPDDEDLLFYMGLDPSEYDTKQARERRRQAKKEARQEALKSKLSFITNALASETTETSPTKNNSNMNRMARRQNAKLNKSSSKKDFIERSSNVVTDELTIATPAKVLTESIHQTKQVNRNQNQLLLPEQLLYLYCNNYSQHSVLQILVPQKRHFHTHPYSVHRQKHNNW